MAGQPVMTYLMSDAEALESFAINMRGVGNTKLIAYADQHTGDTSGGGLGLDQDAKGFGNRYRVNRHAIDSKFLD